MSCTTGPCLHDSVSLWSTQHGHQIDTYTPRCCTLPDVFQAFYDLLMNTRSFTSKTRRVCHGHVRYLISLHTGPPIDQVSIARPPTEGMLPHAPGWIRHWSQASQETITTVKRNLNDKLQATNGEIYFTRECVNLVMHTNFTTCYVERSVQIYIPYERTFSLVFWEEEWLVGAAPSTWNFGSTDPRWTKSPIFNQ